MTFQVGLSTLLLATACFAVWWSDWSGKSEITQLESRLRTMRPLLRELVIKDGDHVAVIHQTPTFYDQNIWQTYIPNDSLSLYMATRNLASPDGEDIDEVTPVARAPLSQGRHTIELRNDAENGGWMMRVLVDHEVVIEVEETNRWKEGRGSRGGANYSKQADQLPGVPVVLFHRVFSEYSPRVGPPAPSRGNGIRLWIE